ASRAFLFDPPAAFAEYGLVRPRGALHIGTEAQIPLLDAFVAKADVRGLARRVDSAEVRKICPVLRPECAAGGVFEPDAADIDVDALHQGYLRLFRKR